MSTPSRPRVLVLAKKSALAVHRERGDASQHARIEQLLRINDPTVTRMIGADRQHEATFGELTAALRSLGVDARLVVASALDEFKQFSPSASHPPASGAGGGTAATDEVDLVVTVGGDGTLLAASHAIADTPILAINSAPDYSVGFFCAGRMGAVRETLARALGGELPITVLTRMQVHLDDRLLTSRVLNEALVCAGSPAATSRYLIEHRGALEDQKSSGLWIGPAAGSTAAQRSAGGRVLPLRSNKLQFVVREPYTPAGQSLALTRGLVAPNERLRVIMKSTDGHLYVDGPHEVHRVTIGETLVFSASPEPLRLVGVRSRRGWRVRGGGR